MVLLARRHRVFAPDWPGHGESDSPDLDYSTDYFLDFLGRLLDALGLEKASLAGSSLGAGVALGFALRSPERIDRLVLVGSFGLGSQVPWRVISYLVVRLPLVNRMIWAALNRSRRMVKVSLRSVIYDPKVITEELVNEVYQEARKAGAGKAYRSWQRSEISWKGLRTDFVGKLPSLRAPTLILHGEMDRFVPVSWAERAHRLIKGSELRVFQGCKHWIPRERPDEFNRVVQEFLARP